jgi:hypothetical protein
MRVVSLRISQIMEGLRSSECDREAAIRWAKRNGFSDSKLPEFKSMLALIQSTYIDRKELEGAVFLDKGAFGAIDRALYHGTVSLGLNPCQSVFFLITTFTLHSL